MINKIKNRFIYHTLLKYHEFQNSKHNNINPRNTLLIFSNPRGGSTWLSEILMEIPNSALCWEPLSQKRLIEFKRLNFFTHHPIPSKENWEEAEKAFQLLLNREILRLSIYYKNDLSKLPHAETFIFKFCHGNMLLEWLVEKFPINPILLVRHPCAVVSSQLYHGGWKDLKQGKINYQVPNFSFNETYLKYIDILNSVKNIEENLAATWCLTMSNSLASQSNNINWITVAYENLYTNYEEEIERIFSRLSLPIPPAVFDKRKQISLTTAKSSEKHIKSGKQLSSWKNNLTKKQQNNILGIVQEFGLDNYYNLDSYPNLNNIYNQ